MWTTNSRRGNYYIPLNASGSNVMNAADESVYTNVVLGHLDIAGMFHLHQSPGTRGHYQPGQARHPLTSLDIS